jgi:predicted anti-sigma-YlaC factor YlaD
VFKLIVPELMFVVTTFGAAKELVVRLVMFALAILALVILALVILALVILALETLAFVIIVFVVVEFDTLKLLIKALAEVRPVEFILLDNKLDIKAFDDVNVVLTKLLNVAFVVKVFVNVEFVACTEDDEKLVTEKLLSVLSGGFVYAETKLFNVVC